MTSLQIASLIGLLIYFAVLLFAVSKDKKNTSVLDYFFAGRSLPFWALSITFIVSWWGAGSAISTADLAYSDGLGAFWYYGVPVLLSTFLMILGAKAIRRVGYLTQGKMMTARYSEGVAKILSVMILIFMTFSAASQMVGVGNFFGTYLGLDYELAVLVVTAIVMDYMPPLLGAVAFVGISAAIMSTMDSLINTGAMTLAIDLNTKEQDENKKLRFSRAATLIVTAVALLISLGIRSILEISWIASDVITTGVFVPLVAGFVWRRGNTKGAMASMLWGLSYCIYNLLITLGIGLPSFWKSQSAEQVILGVTSSAVVYIVVSLCTKPEYEKADAFIAMASLFGKKKKDPS